MNYLAKATLTTVSCAAIWTNQLMANLPLISFESPEYNPADVLGQSSGTGWSLLSGNAVVSANGQGFGGGQALKIEANAAQEPLLVRDIEWNVSEKIAFIDLQLKPAADPEGSLASFLRTALSSRSKSQSGQIPGIYGFITAVLGKPIRHNGRKRSELSRWLQMV